MIANLAQELNDEETLRELYLLTVADMSMVAPGNLTEWKEQLLRELYVRTMAFYHRGADLGRRRQRARRRRAPHASASPSCSASPRRAGRLVRVAARSLRGADAAARRSCATCSSRAAARGRSPSRWCTARARRSATSPSCADDAPGLLSQDRRRAGGPSHRRPRRADQLARRRRRASSRRSICSPRAIATAAPSPTPRAGSASRRIWRACSAAASPSSR